MSATDNAESAPPCERCGATDWAWRAGDPAVRYCVACEHVPTAESPSQQVTALILSCGCVDDAFSDDEDPTLPAWEVGEATFCNMNDDHGLVDVVEVRCA